MEECPFLKQRNPFKVLFTGIAAGRSGLYQVDAGVLQGAPKGGRFPLSFRSLLEEQRRTDSNSNPLKSGLE